MKTCIYPGCEAYTEGTTDYCGSHNFQLRKEKRDALKVKVVKPIRKVSSKRAEKLKSYKWLRKDFLKAHPFCQLKLVDCMGKSTEIHHVSTSDLDFLNTKTWKAACRWCHFRTETILSAKERREKGMLI